MKACFGWKDGTWGLTEESTGVIVTWLAFVLYNSIAYYERNPIYGFVFCWAMGAIFSETNDAKPQLTMIWYNSLIATSVHFVSMAFLSGYLLFEWLQDDIF